MNILRFNVPPFRYFTCYFPSLRMPDLDPVSVTFPGTLREFPGITRNSLGSLTFSPSQKEHCKSNMIPRIYLQYKKNKADKAMPSDVEGRRKRCPEVMLRESPTVSPHQSDDEGDDFVDGDVGSVGELANGAFDRANNRANPDVVAALLGLCADCPGQDCNDGTMMEGCAD